jgi:hypothetical protein
VESDSRLHIALFSWTAVKKGNGSTSRRDPLIFYGFGQVPMNFFLKKKKFCLLFKGITASLLSAIRTEI